MRHATVGLIMAGELGAFVDKFFHFLRIRLRQANRHSQSQLPAMQGKFKQKYRTRRKEGHLLEKGNRGSLLSTAGSAYPYSLRFYMREGEK